jgi:hypothetical protein
LSADSLDHVGLDPGYFRAYGRRLSDVKDSGVLMNTYVILRRSGWQSPEELQEAAGRSKTVGDEQMSADIRWIRSYVLQEDGGSVGTVCIYQATSPEAIREHASRADLPVDEVIQVADTVIVRPDPEAATV